MSIRTATVEACGLVTHPNSNEQRMRYEVSCPFTMVGQEYPTTRVWADASAPEVIDGESISWGHRFVWVRGERYAKREYDSSGRG
jgi:hypothetical protein